MEEYKKNSKKEKNLFKKYGKYIRKAIVGGAIAVIGALVIPGLGLGEIAVKFLPFLNKIIPNPFDAAATITVWASIITSTIGTIKGAINGIKAYKVKEELKDSLDEEEELIDTLNLELEKAKEKNKHYENEISKLREKVPTVIETKTKNKSHDNEISEVIDKDAFLEEELHIIKK